MTDKKLIETLAPLESKMLKYVEKKEGVLTADDIQIIKNVYPTLQQLAMNQLPRVFVTSCSSCVREVFNIVISVYFRLKDKKQPEASNEAIEVKLLTSGTTEYKGVVNKKKEKKN